MTAATQTSSPRPTLRADKALALALRLAHAEKALHVLTKGQVDAIVDPSGQTYLLRPAQERLRENERRLRVLLDGVADVVTVVSRGGLILSQSFALKRVLGYEPEELIGKTIFEFVHPDDLPLIYSALSDVSEECRAAATIEFRHQARDGWWRTLEASVGKLTHPAGSIILALRTVTSRRQEQEALRQLALSAANLATDRGLALLARDLRTPLEAALRGLDSLENDPRFAEAKPMLNEVIRRNLEIQARLLDLLTREDPVNDAGRREAASALIEGMSGTMGRTRPTERADVGSPMTKPAAAPRARSGRAE